MNLNKESELINAIIVYFHRCQEEGDYSALQEMGFGPSEVRALNSLSSADKLRLTSTKSHFLSIDLNQKIYWRMIDYILREKDKESVIDELISCDAPLQLMRSLTGMGNKQFNHRRRQFGMATQLPGRPPQPSMEVEKSVWLEVEKSLKNTASFGPEEFLNIFDGLKRQVSLRVIWSLIKEWENDGSLRQIRNV